MLLYTCKGEKKGAPMHPCGRAAKSLDDGGHDYTIEMVEGLKLLPWTRRGKRDKIRELTGQEDVLVLVLDDGATVVGHKAIVAWAKEHPAGAPAGPPRATRG